MRKILNRLTVVNVSVARATCAPFSGVGLTKFVTFVGERKERDGKSQLDSPALPSTKRSRTRPTGVTSMLSKLGHHVFSKVT